MDYYYCLIKLQNDKRIVLSLLENDIRTSNSVYPICFTASSSYLMHSLISVHGCFKDLSISHVLYIGQELYKAELSSLLNQVYVQN